MKPGAGAEDRHWMEQALALAALGDGATSPNPRVGCVLVRDGQVVGRGYHEAAGLPHAEGGAVAEAGDRARGATAYVNLEPCAHRGRTPPCADLLIEAGVRRVVAAIVDPNPLVNGRGFDRLRAAGLEVEVGCHEEEARRLNDAFLHWHRHGRPLVTLKAAASIDGLIAGQDGYSQWITGPWARRFAHRLRARHDAVLVGVGTVRRDDPRLTVRLPGSLRSPLRVVLSPSLDIPETSQVLVPDGERRTRVYVGESVDADRDRRFRDRADVIRVPSVNGGGLALDRVLADLAGAGIQSVLVEGGGRTLAGFLAASLADRAAVFQSARLFGARGGTPMVDGTAVARPDAGWKLARMRQIPLGDDVLLIGDLVAPADPAVPG
jgi:diaminohydroxyphosphoribosylaminopyrimidine deaminase/5-amino-6-(5-phosphoribosylamino)uracil reductase